MDEFAIALLVHLCFSVSCWIASAQCPSIARASMRSQTQNAVSVHVNQYCYYIAEGGESCQDLCQRVSTQMQCSEVGLTGVFSLNNCKNLISDFGLGWDYEDGACATGTCNEDYGCAYGDWNNGRYVQLSMYDGNNPPSGRCEGTSNNLERHFICACEAACSVSADFSQSNLAGTQATSVAGVLDISGDNYIFSWINGGLRKMVLVDKFGSKIKSGYDQDDASKWTNSTTWTNQIFSFYDISNFQNSCEATTTTASDATTTAQACKYTIWWSGYSGTYTGTIEYVGPDGISWDDFATCVNQTAAKGSIAENAASYCNSTWDLELRVLRRTDNNEIIGNGNCCNTVNTMTSSYNTCQATTTAASDATTTPQASMTTTTTIGTTAVDVTSLPPRAPGVLKGQLRLSATEPAKLVSEPNFTSLLTQVVAGLYDVVTDWVHNLTAEYREDRRLVDQDLGSALQSRPGIGVRGSNPVARRLDVQVQTGDIDVEWKVLIPPGSQGEVVVELLAETFNSKTIAEATSAINTLINSGMLGDPYSLNVSWKYTVVEDAVAPQINPDPEDDSMAGIIVVVLCGVIAVGALLSTLVIGIWMKRRAKSRTDHPFAKLGLVSASAMLKKKKKNGGKFSMEDLLHPPEAITAEQGRRVREFASDLLDDYSVGLSAKVFVSYTSGNRESDAEGYGPGSYYAAAILKVLTENGITCFSELMLPDDHASRKLYCAQLGSRGHSCEVLIVLQTKELYNDRSSLREIYLAQLANTIRILPLRFEENLPAISEAWPSITRQDMEGMLMVSSVTHKFCRLNSVPSPPYTVVNQPDVLMDIIADLKLKASNAKASNANDAGNHADDVATPMKLGATGNGMDVLGEDPISPTRKGADDFCMASFASLPVYAAASSGASEKSKKRPKKAASEDIFKDRKDLTSPRSARHQSYGSNKSESYSHKGSSSSKRPKNRSANGSQVSDFASPRNQEEVKKHSAAAKIQAIQRGRKTRQYLEGIQLEDKSRKPRSKDNLKVQRNNGSDLIMTAKSSSKKKPLNI